VAVVSIESIAKEITSKLGGILAVRIYLGIADSSGQLVYLDPELEQFKDFIYNFVKNNFKYLKVGDHSLPISGRNIMFFRLPKAMVIIYSVKGRVGQLLSFKSLLPKYMNSFDPFVPDLSPELQRQETQLIAATPRTETITTAPVETIEKPVFSRKEAYLKEIHPRLGKKIKEGAKFSLTTSVLLNYSDGENSILDLFDRTDIEEDIFYTEFYKLYKGGWIKIPAYELFQIQCPTCKTPHYQFVPTAFLKTSPTGKIRFQMMSEVCEHTFYVTIDKKQKVKTKAIPLLERMEDTIDFSDLTIKSCIKFFGQDNFFNIFHAIFFKNSVLFLEQNHYAEKITDFMKKFFPSVSYQNEIQSLSRDQFFNVAKKFADCLVIDLNSNIIVNEPYETEDFDFELRLFREILKEPDDNVQILKAHSVFEQLILITDTILNEIEMYKEIKEEELIDLMKKNHNITIERSEIPIIKELADIYYGVDIHKKITKTLVGQVSDWLGGI